jgi:hypothetical protein
VCVEHVEVLVALNDNDVTSSVDTKLVTQLEKLPDVFVQNVKHLTVTLLFPEIANGSNFNEGHPFDLDAITSSSKATSVVTRLNVEYLTSLLPAINRFSNLTEFKIIISAPAEGIYQFLTCHLDHFLPFYDLVQGRLWRPRWSTYSSRISHPIYGEPLQYLTARQKEIVKERRVAATKGPKRWRWDGGAIKRVNNVEGEHTKMSQHAVKTETIWRDVVVSGTAPAPKTPAQRTTGFPALGTGEKETKFSFKEGKLWSDLDDDDDEE